MVIARPDAANEAPIVWFRNEDPLESEPRQLLEVSELTTIWTPCVPSRIDLHHGVNHTGDPTLLAIFDDLLYDLLWPILLRRGEACVVASQCSEGLLGVLCQHIHAKGFREVIVTLVLNDDLLLAFLAYPQD